jgi:hypothetical protein
MFVRNVATAVIIGLIFVSAGLKPAFAKENVDRQARQTEKVKAGIAKLGTGESARLEVKLKDKSKLVGFVREIGNNSFVVTDPKTGVSSSVAYDDVTKVKGHNLSTGAKIAIGVGIGIAIAFLIIMATGGINT